MGRPVPYNGERASSRAQVPRFTRIARSYLLRAENSTGGPSIEHLAGSMIQAVADDESAALWVCIYQRANILKVLNPAFWMSCAARRGGDCNAVEPAQADGTGHLPVRLRLGNFSGYHLQEIAAEE